MLPVGGWTEISTGYFSNTRQKRYVGRGGGGRILPGGVIITCSADAGDGLVAVHRVLEVTKCHRIVKLHNGSPSATELFTWPTNSLHSRYQTVYYHQWSLSWSTSIQSRIPHASSQSHVILSSIWSRQRICWSPSEAFCKNKVNRHSMINSTKYPASRTGTFSEPRLMSHKSRSRVRADQCVSAIGAVELPLFACLRSSCNHVTGVGGP
jgi:hypothetical protein